MTHDVIMQQICSKKHSTSLEMLIICNTETPEQDYLPQENVEGNNGRMQLGMNTVNSLIHHCPQLMGLGNLRTWSDIDYYQEGNCNYYRSDTSELGQLKQKAVKVNWDLDLEMENLDYLYKNGN